MTSFGEIVFEAIGIALRVFSLLIVIGQIDVVFNAFMQKRSGLCRILTAAQLLTGLMWFCLLLDCSFTVDYAPSPRTYPALVLWVHSVPWIVVLFINLALAAVLCLSFVENRRYRRTHISQNAVKETVDLLPVGICFANEDGVVSLKNLQMESLCAVLCGKSLVDANAFWAEVKDKGEQQGDVLIVPMPNGEAFLFQKEPINVDGRIFAQIIAYDVTAQYHITEELKTKHKKLVDLQTRMKAFSTMTAQLAMSEEILKARVTVHDEMGHLLLAGKYYLDNAETANAEKLLQMERFTHQMLMREGEEPDEAKPDSVQNAVQIARVMGVKVNISGTLPESEAAREIVAQAIRECAANTVKHANGDRLDVTLNGGQLRLTCNGNAPDAPVTESGGLLMLRRKAEASGGGMVLSYTPQLTVTISLPSP